MSTSSDASSSDEDERRIIGAATARRRFATAATVVIEDESRRIFVQRRKTSLRKDWQGHVAREGHQIFRRMYRMHLYYFNDLFQRIRSKIETRDVEMAIRSSGSAVCAEIRLAMTLRYLAGGSVWDIRSNFSVSKSEFYRSVWGVVDALNEEFPIDLDISDVDKLKAIEEGFAQKSRQNVIRGAIGAIDGCLIPQKNPGSSVENAGRYYCARKEKYSILLMAMCDADRRFLWFDMSCTPTTHDSLAWLTTELGQRFERGELPSPFFVLGDSAFTCTLNMISPGKDDDFNFEQSSLRINIECAFGQLIRRWGILWKQLEMKFEKRTGVIGCCIRLHNFCIDCRIELESELMKIDGLIEIMPGHQIVPPLINSVGSPVNYLHTECRCPSCSGSARATAKADTRRREQLEEAVREKGLIRPYRRV